MFWDSEREPVLSIKVRTMAMIPLLLRVSIGVVNQLLLDGPFACSFSIQIKKKRYIENINVLKCDAVFDISLSICVNYQLAD